MNSSRICCTRLDEPSGSYETEKGIWCWYCWWYQWLWLWSVEQFLKGIRTQKSSECVGSIFFADVGLGRQQMCNISIKCKQGFSVCNLTILLEHSGKHGFQIRKDIQIYHMHTPPRASTSSSKVGYKSPPGFACLIAKFGIKQIE